MQIYTIHDITVLPNLCVLIDAAKFVLSDHQNRSDPKWSQVINVGQFPCRISVPTSVAVKQ